MKLVWIGDLDFTSSVPLNPTERYTVKLTNKGTTIWTLVTTINVSVNADHTSSTVTNN